MRDPSCSSPNRTAPAAEGSGWAVRCLRRAPAAAALAACLFGPVMTLAAPSPAAKAFGLADVEAIARCLVAAPGTPACARTRAPALAAGDAAPVPQTWAKMDYDTFRDIRYRPERSLWRGQSPFEMDMFPRGWYFPLSVQVSEITERGVQPVKFDPAAFDYGRVSSQRRADAPAGWSGVRMFYPMNVAGQRDELAVFLGASYFRALGRGLRYGLSARGLAIDTVGGSGEEFPRFTHFWIERPGPAARSLVLYALLQSPRAAGAYRFEMVPGAQAAPDTVIDVQARIYAKAGVNTLGVAPLTSMFFSGENQPFEGFRPEIHDSDGLSVHAADGEWLWRPLMNPKQPTTTSFQLSGLRGFGLMQRDRQFASYEDTEARYELRPSAWVEPVGDWGPGRVELYQLPAADETYDNIVAYWVPAALPPLGQALSVAYRLHWQGEQWQRPDGGAWTTQSRVGRGFQELPADETKYVIDFDGPRLRALPAAAAAMLKPVVTTSANAQVAEAVAFANEATGGWRLALRLKRLPQATANLEPIEVRAFLQVENQALTETWTHLIPPR